MTPDVALSFLAVHAIQFHIINWDGDKPRSYCDCIVFDGKNYHTDESKTCSCGANTHNKLVEEARKILGDKISA